MVWKSNPGGSNCGGELHSRSVSLRLFCKWTWICVHLHGSNRRSVRSYYNIHIYNNYYTNSYNRHIYNTNYYFNNTKYNNADNNYNYHYTNYYHNHADYNYNYASYFNRTAYHTNYNHNGTAHLRYKIFLCFIVSLKKRTVCIISLVSCVTMYHLLSVRVLKVYKSLCQIHLGQSVKTRPARVKFFVLFDRKVVDLAN